MLGSKRGDDKGRREVAVEGKKASVKDLQLSLDVEGVVEGEPSQNGGQLNQLNPRPRSAESTSTQKPHVSQPLLLTVSSGGTDNSPVLYHDQRVLGADEREPDTADGSVYESVSSWESTASATTKSFLDTVKGSSDAFGPLKSLAGNLCVILENCEVPAPSHPFSPPTLTIFLGDRSK